MSSLDWKPKAQQTRVIYSGDPSGVDSVKLNPGKVFAVIGPFENFTDKADLRDALELLVRGHNLKET